MDWKAAASIYGIMLITGTVVSLISTQLQCSKVNFSVAFIQGLQFATISIIPYALTYFDIVRNNFISPFTNMFGPAIGLGLVIMLIAWPAGALNVVHSEAQTCVSSTAEMTEFKSKLMKELADKQAAEEANANAKPSK
jgi:uncharacterized membrane protein YdfJ with MMPL/SSD domain